MSLIEGIAGIAILSLAAVAAMSAAFAGAHVAASPAIRDRVLAAASNAAVEARAAAAYDPAAAAAILAAPGATWTSGGVTLQSSVQGQTLTIVATSGNERAGIGYTVAAEALPQGAIVDTTGNLITP